MTIWRKENPVPWQLPAARLYLDDLEAILDILLDARNNPAGETVPSDKKVTSTFVMGNDVCDEIADLQKLGKRTAQMEVTLKIEGDTSFEAGLEIDPYDTRWMVYGLTREQSWRTYRRLEALFGKRRLRWTSFLHTHFFLAPLLGFVAFALLVLGAAVLFQGDLSIMKRSIVSGAMIFPGLILAAAVLRVRRHSEVIFRRSWDDAASREELKAKVAVSVLTAVIGGIVGIAGTLIGLYVKHKYLP